MYANYIKRALDIIIATIVIILLFPLFLLLCLFVYVVNGKPVIFKQNRPGRNEMIFSMYKFRTMTNRIDKNGEVVKDEDRITKFGRFLRATSLDELPEFIIVLKGDMSLVGPRPLLVEYLELYNEEQKKRHHVRPGITGLAQVNGRNAISWEEKFEYDVEYVENITFLGDCGIILKTVKKVFVREGINTVDNKVMEPFRGSQSFRD